MNFRDRTSLGGYWWTVLINVSIGIALFVYMYLSTSGAVSGFVNPLAGLGPMAPIIFAVAWPAIIIIPNIAMTIRRLHDTGRSGLCFFFAFIPIAGTVIMIFFLTSSTKDPQKNKYGRLSQV